MTENGEETGLTIRDCAFTALATGEEARSLRELRDRVARIPPGSLYYHFSGRLLRPLFDAREYVNDFGNWVGYELRELDLAERMALLDPADYSDMEELREWMVELLEEHLARESGGREVPLSRAFHFLKGKIVVFDTGRTVRHPKELPDVIPVLSRSSIYYHFVDARARSADGVDDLQRWLLQRSSEYRPLAAALAAVDLHYTSLEKLQTELTHLFEDYFRAGETS